MDTFKLERLENKFLAMGARLNLSRSGIRVALDVLRDRQGEYYSLNIAEKDPEDFIVMDLRKKARHLLLLERNETGERPSRYLCGHDEREWFVCAVPEKSGAGTVLQAMEALKPEPVRWAVERKGVKRKNRNRRRNAAFIRQGEWFFIPAPHVSPEPVLILKKEPISRPGGKPHLVDESVRVGGRQVYQKSGRGRVFSEIERARLLKENPKARGWRWLSRRIEPEVYVRGSVKHPDHRTIHLDGWHRVLMNTEGQATAAQNVVFLD